MDVQREQIVPNSFPTEILQKDWSNRKCFCRKGSKDFMKVVHEMEIKDDDVWLITYPKSGTTWMQELVWLVLNDYDFETALNVDIGIRSPYLQFDFIQHGNASIALKRVEELKSPRLIKSHLPLPLLPKQLWTKKPKVVYVARNIKDAVVSFYYFSRSMGRVDLSLSLDEYIALSVKKDLVELLPYDHVTEFYALRNEPWVFYTSFEKMKKNLREVIEDVCKFLNKPINEEQMQQMLKHLSFEEMKNNPAVQHTWELTQHRAQRKAPFEETRFVREGGSEKHKEVLSPASIELLDQWLVEQEAKHNVSMRNLILLDDN